MKGEKQAREYRLTDEQVEEEIKRVLASPAYKLARYEQYVKTRRRQYMYALRATENRGLALMEKGVTKEALDSMYPRGDDASNN